MSTLLLKSCNLPGVKVTGWANNVLEIKLDGNILYTFHGVPESAHLDFLRCSDPRKALQQLEADYPMHDHKQILG